MTKLDRIIRKLVNLPPNTTGQIPTGQALAYARAAKKCFEQKKLTRDMAILAAETALILAGGKPPS